MISTNVIDQFENRFQNVSIINISYFLSDPFVKLSDAERKPQDILSDLSDTEIFICPTEDKFWDQES